MKFLEQLRAIIEELCAVLFLALTYFFYQTPFDPKGVMSNNPILLIHGYMHNSSGWWLFRNRLVRQGFGPVYTINLGSVFRSLETYTDRVEKKVNEILIQTGAKEVVLIGHSMGGVIAAAYAVRPGSKTNQVITIGSPLEGSYVAYITFGRSAVELRPDSPFLKQLKRDLSQNQTLHFYHIYSNYDELIQPNKSAAPLFTPNHKIELVSMVGHITQLFSRRVFSKVVNRLHAINGL